MKSHNTKIPCPHCGNEIGLEIRTELHTLPVVVKVDGVAQQAPLTKEQFEEIKRLQIEEEMKSVAVAGEVGLEILVVNKAFLCKTYKELLSHLQ